MKRQLSPLRASTEYEQSKKQYPACPHCEAPTQEECVCVACKAVCEKCGQNYHYHTIDPKTFDWVCPDGQTGELEKARNREREHASIKSGDDFDEQEPPDDDPKNDSYAETDKPMSGR